MKHLEQALAAKAEEFRDDVRLGRTCMQDAVPLTLGQEFGAFQHAVERLAGRLRVERERWNKSCLGGTAVGTGLNAPPGFAEQAAEQVSRLTGKPFVTAPNKFHALTSKDELVFAHGAVKALACAPALATAFS